MVNKVVLIDNLGRDLELFQAPSGRTVARRAQARHGHRRHKRGMAL